MFNILYKLLLYKNDWDLPEPGEADPNAFDGWSTGFWVITIFCLILFGLADRDKHK